MELTQRELAQLFGVDVRTIQRWGPQGLDDTRIGGKAVYDAPAAVAWRLEFVVAQEREKHATGEREELELEKLRHQNREARVKADLAESRAVLVDDAAELWEESVGTIRAVLLQVPVRHADTARPDDPAAGEDALERIIDDTFRTLEQAFALPEDLDAGGDS